MDRTIGGVWHSLGCFSALISVAAGAFAAHALKPRLSPDLLAVFETGAEYQMYHALALLAVGALHESRRGRLAPIAGVAFTLGTLLFSGSLYALALSGARWLGAITPFGGVAFLIGWFVLGVAALQRARPARPT